MSKNYRIKDIAELSGVSTGTVDRILHNRGKVSIEAQQKVDKVLKEINYQPNLIARSLALKKNYLLYALVPSYKEGEYWELFCSGIQKAEKELFSYNVEIKYLYFNQYDKNSFDEMARQVVESDCQGVVIATLFKESALTLTQQLDQKSIPYVLVDAYLEKTNCIAYYGTHSYDSGFIAGRLMHEQLQPEDDIAIFRFIRKGEELSNQVQQREKGFRDYLSRQAFNGKIHIVHIYAEDISKNDQLLDEFLNNYPNIRRGIIFNSRAYILANYLKAQHPELNFKLIGYDVINKNVDHLKENRITHLIAQRPEVQAVNSVRALFKFLIEKVSPEKINYMPIDILMKENIAYYNNYI